MACRSANRAVVPGYTMQPQWLMHRQHARPNLTERRGIGASLLDTASFGHATLRPQTQPLAAPQKTKSPCDRQGLRCNNAAERQSCPYRRSTSRHCSPTRLLTEASAAPQRSRLVMLELVSEPSFPIVLWSTLATLSLQNILESTGYVRMGDTMTSEEATGQGLPGQELESAAAKVATKAGVSLVRGIANVADAFFAEWVANKKATAAATRLQIKTQAEIDRTNALAANERKQNIDAIDHAEVMNRRLARLGREFVWQQENFESIALRSIEITEQDPMADKPRVIENDWIFRFSRLAQDASDNDIRELWAQILSSAAIEGRHKASPAALQIMSLVDRQTAIDFRKFCEVASTFSFFPAYDNVYEKRPQNIDIENLEELGLIQADPLSGIYPFGDFVLHVGPVAGTRVGMLRTTFSLTLRGSEIANAVFGRDILIIDEAMQQIYLQQTISNQINSYYLVSISLPSKDGNFSVYDLQIMPRRAPTLERYNLSPIEPLLSDRLKSLLNWAHNHYEVIPVPPGT
jgi:hypothetical protein